MSHESPGSSPRTPSPQLLDPREQKDELPFGNHDFPRKSLSEYIESIAAAERTKASDDEVDCGETATEKQRGMRVRLTEIT